MELDFLRPKNTTPKILTYEYNETENLWKVISTLDLHSLVETNSNIVKVVYSDDLKTVAIYYATTDSDSSLFFGVFEYNDEQSEWSLKGNRFLASGCSWNTVKLSKQATTLLTTTDILILITIHGHLMICLIYHILLKATAQQIIGINP